MIYAWLVFVIWVGSGFGVVFVDQISFGWWCDRNVCTSKSFLVLGGWRQITKRGLVENQVIRSRVCYAFNLGRLLKGAIRSVDLWQARNVSTLIVTRSMAAMRKDSMVSNTE